MIRLWSCSKRVFNVVAKFLADRAGKASAGTQPEIIVHTHDFIHVAADKDGPDHRVNSGFSKITLPCVGLVSLRPIGIKISLILVAL